MRHLPLGILHECLGPSSRQLDSWLTQVMKISVTDIFRLPATQTFLTNGFQLRLSLKSGLAAKPIVALHTAYAHRIYLQHHMNL